ncbi:MAG TPA: phospholipid carrier-dependent glycosyltransferase [Anaerolineae bacterium]|nr:phospholipid carrier-dependent glycosyltransferase [Anaerolineae bacterium]
MRDRLRDHNIIGWGVLLGVVTAFCLWQMAHLGGFRWDYDEGAHMMQAYLMLMGYPLYAETFSGQPPLLISALAGAFALLGPSVQVGRALMVACATLGLLALGLVARQLHGWAAAAATVVLLGIAPDFFLYSRVSMGDVPSSSLAALAVLCALCYRNSGRRRWVVAAGLALGAGCLLKFTTVFALPLVAAVVALRRADGLSLTEFIARSERKRWLKIGLDLVWLAGAFALPLLVCLLAFDVPAMYDQLFVFHWQARAAFRLDRPANLGQIGEYLLKNSGLSALAAYGCISLFLRRRAGRGFLIVAWFFLLAAVLTNHAPLWPHLLVMVLFPLALGGGVAIGELVQYALAQGDQSWQRVVLLFIGLGAAALYLTQLPSIVETNSHRLMAYKTEVGLAATDFVASVTDPDGWIITDEPLVPFCAGRKMPPYLSDISYVRTQTGYLTADDLIAFTEEYRPQAIVVWSEGRFTQRLPAYVEWVEQNYRLATSFGPKRRIYVPLSP